MCINYYILIFNWVDFIYYFKNLFKIINVDVNNN